MDNKFDEMYDRPKLETWTWRWLWSTPQRILFLWRYCHEFGLPERVYATCRLTVGLWYWKDPRRKRQQAQRLRDALSKE